MVFFCVIQCNQFLRARVCWVGLACATCFLLLPRTRLTLAQAGRQNFMIKDFPNPSLVKVKSEFLGSKFGNFSAAATKRASTGEKKGEHGAAARSKAERSEHHGTKG